MQASKLQLQLSRNFMDTLLNGKHDRVQILLAVLMEWAETDETQLPRYGGVGQRVSCHPGVGRVDKAPDILRVFVENPQRQSRQWRQSNRCTSANLEQHQEDESQKQTSCLHPGTSEGAVMVGEGT